MKDVVIPMIKEQEMCSFAIYRLPGDTHCTLMAQPDEPLELSSATELNGKSGFVLAPFAVSAECPILLIQPVTLSSFCIDDIPAALNEERLMPGASREVGNEESPTEREHYAIDFANFHAQLTEGRFQKLVLARSKFISATPKRPLELFCQACRLYPNAFVAWVKTPRSGDWLMATPEVLLQGEGEAWHTMALAGTMEAPIVPKRHSGDDGSPTTALHWSIKNIQEQRYVATYIMQNLERFASQIQEEGPVTVQAANVVHLRSDFHFTLDHTNQIGTLLQALHPTPAVCGLPKGEAQDFIVRNEASRRRYYSGFSGPLQLEGATHLFVSLRCMQLGVDGYRLYAGGGLLIDSEEEMEWNETEAKMQAMMQLITPPSPSNEGALTTE